MLSMGTSLPSSVHWLYGSPSLKDSVYNHSNQSALLLGPGGEGC